MESTITVRRALLYLQSLSDASLNKWSFDNPMSEGLMGKNTPGAHVGGQACGPKEKLDDLEDRLKKIDNLIIIKFIPSKSNKNQYSELLTLCPYVPRSHVLVYNVY